MYHRIVFFVTGLLLLVSNVYTQTIGKSPYPVIFVHGFNSDGDTWNVTVQQLETVFGDYDTYTDMFHAVLNANASSTKHEDDVRTVLQEPDGTSVNEFLSPDGSLFTLNFKNSLDGNDRILVNEPGTSSGTSSAGNRNSVVKQGKALGLMITKILERTSADKVILVGHSMGGLAIREYLQRYDGTNHPWWTDQTNSSWNGTGHKVAKVVTIGTPHVGTNIWAVNDLLPWEEAVRDVRWEYPDIPNTKGLYLFGGVENSPGIQFRNEDVDCDGDITSMIEGINTVNTFTFNSNMLLPSDIEYTWITSDDILFPGGDGIVDLSRQWLHNGNDPTPSTADTLLTHRNHFALPGFPSTGEPSDIVSITRALDEPESEALAYEVKSDILYSGLITDQPHGDVNHTPRSSVSPGSSNLDYDLYRFEYDGSGDIEVDITASNSGAYFAVLYIANTYTVTGKSLNSGSSAKLRIYDTDPGTCYLGIVGDSDNAAFLTPYTFQISVVSGTVNIALTVGNEIGIFSTPIGASLYDGTEFIGATPYPLTLEQNQSKTLTAKLSGYYDKTFTVDWNDGDQVVEVTLEPTSTGTGGTGGSLDLMAITPGFLDFGLIDTSLTFYVSSETSPGSINWNVTPSQNWITVNPLSGLGSTNPPESVIVTVDRSTLSGLYEETITINSTAGTIYMPIVVDANSQWPGPYTQTFPDNSAFGDWLLVEGTADSSGIVNGQLKLGHDNFSPIRGTSDCYLVASGSYFEEVSMTFTFDNGPSEGRNQTTFIYLCYQDESNYYAWQIKEDNRAGVGRTRLRLVKAGSSNPLWESADGWNLPSGTYTASYSKSDLRLVDNQGGSIIDVTVSDVFTYGRVGFGVNEETCRFDNVTVDGVTYDPNDKTTDPFIVDANTIGLWNMTGTVGSAQKKQNEVAGRVPLGEGNTPSSQLGLANKTDGSYGMNRGETFLTTDLDAELDNLSQFTLEFWWQWDGSLYTHILTARGPSGNHSFRVECVETNNSAEGINIYVPQQSWESGRTGFVEFNPALNTWYYIAIVFDGTQSDPNDRLKCYIDGQADNLVFNDTPPTSLVNLGNGYPLLFGNDVQGTGNDNMGGRFGPVRASNIARTSGEINTIYAKTLLTPSPLLSVSPKTLDLGVASSGSLNNIFTITNDGTVTMTGTVTPNGNTTVDLTSINLAAGQSQVYTVSVDVTSLAAGTYNETISLASDGGNNVVAVSYEVDSNLFHNGDAELNEALDQGSQDRWFGSPLSGADYVENSTAAPIAGLRSFRFVKVNGVESKIKQNIYLPANTNYTIEFDLRNESNINGSMYSDCYQTGNPWDRVDSYSFWTNLTPGDYHHTITFTTELEGWHQFQFVTYATGELRLDNFELYQTGGPPPPNQAPVAVDDAATTTEANSVDIGVLANDSDPDGTLDLTSVVISQNPTNGTTSVNTTTGVVTYTPNTGFTGNDSFTYTIKDNEGATSNEATVLMTVNNTSNDYTDDSNNLFVNGQANDSTDLSLGPVGYWQASPLSGSDRVEYTSNAIYGPYSLQIVKGSVQSGSSDTKLLQSVPLESGKTYVLYVLLDNSSNIAGSGEMTNFEHGGSWSWQGLWWSQTLTPGRQLISKTFTPNVTNNVIIQFQWGLVTGTTRIDSLIVKDQALGKRGVMENAGLIIPTEYALYQNYPNPFNPNTQIRFDLPEDTRVSLVIYNMLGQKVKTLVDKPMRPGEYSFTWQGHDEQGRAVSSGIYVYKLQAERFVDIKKMLFLK